VGHAVMRRQRDIVARLDKLAFRKAKGVSLDDLLRESLGLCGRRVVTEYRRRSTSELGREGICSFGTVVSGGRRKISRSVVKV